MHTSPLRRYDRPSGTSRRDSTATAMILVLLLVGLIAAPHQDAGGIRENAPLPSLVIADLEGYPRSLRQQPNEVTLINFWATWCIPCLREVPELVVLAGQLRSRNVRVVGIAIDSGRASDVKQFARAHGMTYTLLMADQVWARDHFAVFGLPITLVVDRAGRVRRRLVGPQTREEFKAALQPYL